MSSNNRRNVLATQPQRHLGTTLATNSATLRSIFAAFSAYLRRTKLARSTTSHLKFMRTCLRNALSTPMIFHRRQDYQIQIRPIKEEHVRNSLVKFGHDYCMYFVFLHRNVCRWRYRSRSNIVHTQSAQWMNDILELTIRWLMQKTHRKFRSQNEELFRRRAWQRHRILRTRELLSIIQWSRPTVVRHLSSQLSRGPRLALQPVDLGRRLGQLGGNHSCPPVISQLSMEAIYWIAPSFTL